MGHEPHRQGRTMKLHPTYPAHRYDEFPLDATRDR